MSAANSKKEKSFIPYLGIVFSIVLAVTTLICSACYLVYKVTSDRAHREKRKDYNDCGLA